MLQNFIRRAENFENAHLHKGKKKRIPPLPVACSQEGSTVYNNDFCQLPFVKLTKNCFCLNKVALLSCKNIKNFPLILMKRLSSLIGSVIDLPTSRAQNFLERKAPARNFFCFTTETKNKKRRTLRKSSAVTIAILPTGKQLQSPPGNNVLDTF